MKPLRLAVDTNVLLDLANRVDTVLDALALFDKRVPCNEKFVVPSVVDELAFLCDFGETQQVRASASLALRVLREEDRFRPVLELTCPSNLVGDVGRELRNRRLLPEEEVHDSLILAEAALLGCALLLTSDQHLRGVDHESLTLILNPFDLVPPVIASPSEIVRRFFR